MSEAKKIEMRLTVYGNALTSIIRDAAERGDIITVLNLMPSELSAEDIRNVLEGKSEFVGNDLDGFELQLSGAKSHRIDVQKRLDAYVKRQRQSAYCDGRDETVEALARWARHEGHPDVARDLEGDCWWDPKLEEEEE